MAKAKEKVKRERPAPKPAVVEMRLRLDLDKQFDRVRNAGIREASQMARETVVGQIKINAELEGKARRVQERARRKLSKVIEKAVMTAGMKSTNLGTVSLMDLTLGENGARATSGEINLKLQNGIADKLASLYRPVMEMMEGEGNLFKKFEKYPKTLKGQLGAGLDDKHFLSGEFVFDANFEDPKASTASYSFEIFAKKGNRKGMHLKYSISHDLAGKSAKGKLEISLPLKKAAAPSKAPAKAAASSAKK